MMRESTMQQQQQQHQHPSRKVQVFILLGQSNMLGMGHVNGLDKDGTLEYAVHTKKRYPWLFDNNTKDWKDPIFDNGDGGDSDDPHATNNTKEDPNDGNGKIKCCNDQQQQHQNQQRRHHRIRHVFCMGSGSPKADPKGKLLHNEWMTIKKCSKIGPEFGIAYELDQIQQQSQQQGEACPQKGGDDDENVDDNNNDNPTTANNKLDDILLLKSCIGNRSLGWDLLPPGSPGFLYQDPKTRTMWRYGGYKDTEARRKVDVDDYDRMLSAEPSPADATQNSSSSPTTSLAPLPWYAGCQYDGDVARAKSILQDISTFVPSNDNDDGNVSYEIAGFFYWQGDKDRYDAAYAGRYETNLVRLIHQLRKDFHAPNAKFVLATLGQTSWNDATNPTTHNAKKKSKTSINDSQIFMAQMAVSHLPEFVNNVKCVYSHPYSHGGASNSHYNGNSETYMDIGRAMGRAMVDLLVHDNTTMTTTTIMDDTRRMEEDGWILV